MYILFRDDTTAYDIAKLIASLKASTKEEQLHYDIIDIEDFYRHGSLMLHIRKGDYSKEILYNDMIAMTIEDDKFRGLVG